MTSKSAHDLYQLQNMLSNDDYFKLTEQIEESFTPKTADECPK